MPETPDIVPCETEAGCAFADSRETGWLARQECRQWQHMCLLLEEDLREGDCPVALIAAKNTITFRNNPEIAREELGFDYRSED